MRGQARSQGLPKPQERPTAAYESDLEARWFVPIENVHGENRAWTGLAEAARPARRLSTETAVGTLAAYAAVCVAVCVAVITTVMASRDLTA